MDTDGFSRPEIFPVDKVCYLNAVLIAGNTTTLTAAEISLANYSNCISLRLIQSQYFYSLWYYANKNELH